MKKSYVKPEVECIEFQINDYILVADKDFSVEIGEEDEEGIG